MHRFPRLPMMLCLFLTGHGALAGVTPWRVGLPVHVERSSAQLVAAKELVVTIHVLEQRRRRGSVDVTFRLEIEGAPSGKTYQLLMQDMGMKQAGLPPVAVPGPDATFQVNSQGQLTPDFFTFSLGGFSRGEWVEFTLRSTDRAVHKTIRYTPLK
jgi:hypothetical protein